MAKNRNRPAPIAVAQPVDTPLIADPAIAELTPTPDACSNCIHWKPITDTLVGVCKRYPGPFITQTTTHGPLVRQPLTLIDDFCGEHKKAQD